MLVDVLACDSEWRVVVFVGAALDSARGSLFGRRVRRLCVCASSSSLCRKQFISLASFVRWFAGRGRRPFVCLSLSMSLVC